MKALIMKTIIMETLIMKTLALIIIMPAPIMKNITL